MSDLKKSSDIDAQRAANVKDGRPENTGVPGWDAKAADDAESQATCSNPECPEFDKVVSTGATLQCPTCGVNYTATAGFGHDVIANENIAANKADPDRDRFDSINAPKPNTGAKPAKPAVPSS